MFSITWFQLTKKCESQNGNNRHLTESIVSKQHSVVFSLSLFFVYNNMGHEHLTVFNKTDRIVEEVINESD